MSCQERQIWKTFKKLDDTCAREWGSTGKVLPTNKLNVSVLLVGNTQIVNVLADGVPGRAMLDSGSQVSTVAEWYYRKYLENSDLISVEELRDLRQVSGQQSEYIGIVAVDLQFPELQSEQTFSAPILVLKDTHV